ncbi:hypothetical protein [Flavobacterium aciduliphilum]|uniref:Uncharacterized protein n=1 Tax=Flavobacterium aciduliphilum TaxID=1101402 RepID=A0A328YLY3_9FLAO|nr:hypothetical protein [Flavobacterium aciduliphilum]RAR73845.1 hypothetical protein CLV55_103164 [Flavobacterium aciduliphilum]
MIFFFTILFIVYSIFVLRLFYKTKKLEKKLKKVLVHLNEAEQSIDAFKNTINAFEALKGKITPISTDASQKNDMEQQDLIEEKSSFSEKIPSKNSFLYENECLGTMEHGVVPDMVSYEQKKEDDFDPTSP